MKLHRIEWGLAIALTALVFSFHAVFLFHAGGLWRDEANTVGVATLPGFRNFLHWLDFDSFPIFWLLVIRIGHAIGLGSDASFRMLGCFVGLGLIVVLWVNARAFRHTLPFASLILLGFCSSVLRWGDSIRAYGFGMVWVILSFSTMWLAVRQPTRRHILLAGVVAVLSVQTLYYNSFLLFAICLAGAAVLVRRGFWKRALMPLGLGAIAACSMTAYIPVFGHSQAWSALFRHPEIDSSWYLQKFSEAAAPEGQPFLFIWLGCFVALIALGIVSLLPRTISKMSEDQQDIALFSSVTLVVSAGAYLLFLSRLNYITEPWYYLAFMALAAACCDAGISAVVNRNRWRLARLAIVALVAFAFCAPLLRAARARMTTVDLIAAQLGQRADPKDFVLACFWHDGVTFARYYRGPAVWDTLPPIEDHRFHRPDLLLPYMTAVNQESALEPLHSRLAKVLQEGHNVWLIGTLQFLQPGQAPLVVAPAPFSSWGWQLGPYEVSWSTQTARFLQQHASKCEEVPFNHPQMLSEYEARQLLKVSGWR